MQLFVRNGRGMLLTIAGRMLLDRTEGLVRQIEQVRDDIKSTGGNPSGRVVLGMVPTVSAVLAGKLARRVLSQFPDIRCASSRVTAGTWSVGASRRDGPRRHLRPGDPAAPLHAIDRL